MVMGLLFLGLPRRFAILPLIASACFMTLGQQIVVAGLHFNALRIVILFGWLRLCLHREFSSRPRFNVLDKLVILHGALSFLIQIILWQTSDVLINQLGFVYNEFGIYFLCRFLISDTAAIEQAIQLTGFCLIPLAGFMLFEMFTGRNPFAFFGGVPEFTMIREGALRCQGPFRHPIIAGTVGAVSMPLFVGFVAARPDRKVWMIAAIVACAAITVASHSSGPALAFGFAGMGLLAWTWRGHMGVIRWAILLSLISLHIVMKAPVWFLIARMSDVIGGGGWHRADLIDQAIKHFGEWWLIGTKSTASWMPYTLESNPNSADITNQFIAEGVGGGLARLCVFVAIIVVCFRRIGATARALENTSRTGSFLVWSVGASLLAHVASFFSVPYWDQMLVFWYMLLSFGAAFRPESLFAEYAEEDLIQQDEVS